MNSLSRRDLRDVVDISHQALACDNLDQLEREALACMERVIGARSSVYAHIFLVDRHLQVREGQERGVPAGAVARWCDSYHEEDPFMQSYLRCLSTSPRNVVVSSEVIDEREYVATRFYNEFMKPQKIYHVMIIGMRSPGSSPIGVIGLHRSAEERAFSRREIAKADLMAPCLRGAVERIQARELISCGTSLQSRDVGLAATDGRTKLEQSMRHCGLSPREREVVELVYQGLPSIDIANRMYISVRTVNNHLRSIYDKTGVHNRTALLYKLMQ